MVILRIEAGPMSWAMDILRSKAVMNAVTMGPLPLYLRYGNELLFLPLKNIKPQLIDFIIY